MNRWLAIVNPAAGVPHANRTLVRRLATDCSGRFEIVTTRGPGDGGRLARQASDYDGLLVVGGDGTIGEVLDGMELPRQQLALLPAGHGNCLARDLGIGTPERAFAALNRASTSPLDLMRVRIGFGDGRQMERLVASTLAVGYVADVVALGRQRFARFGRHAYTAAALTTRPRPLELTISDGASATTRVLTNLVISNTAHLANFRALRHARLDDGKLDVLEAACGWTRQMLHNTAVLAGSERWGPAALWQSSTVAFESSVPSRLMVDGEILEAVCSVTADCEAAAVRWRGAER